LEVAVFGLSLADHLRLTFGHIIHSHKTHTITAERQARRDRWLKAAEAVLLLATAVAAAIMGLTLNPVHAIVAASTATLGMFVLILRLAFDFERTAASHRACSSRLWLIREQYRALLADLKDGAITIEAARSRRDALMDSLQRIYEHAPPIDRELYQSARQSLKSVDEATLTEEEIDRFLPSTLQKPADTSPSLQKPADPPRATAR
jgi:hypothetical protein